MDLLIQCQAQCFSPAVVIAQTPLPLLVMFQVAHGRPLKIRSWYRKVVILDDRDQTHYLGLGRHSTLSN